MKTVDFGAIIVSYNFVIGVLLMLSSQKVATLAGAVNKGHRTQIVRLTDVATFTLGAFWAVLSGFIYLVWHVFRIGL
jgi:uncharacterized membrane protein